MSILQRSEANLIRITNGDELVADIQCNFSSAPVKIAPNSFIQLKTLCIDNLPDGIEVNDETVQDNNVTFYTAGTELILRTAFTIPNGTYSKHDFIELFNKYIRYSIPLAKNQPPATVWFSNPSPSWIHPTGDQQYPNISAALNKEQYVDISFGSKIVALNGAGFTCLQGCAPAGNTLASTGASTVPVDPNGYTTVAIDETPNSCTRAMVFNNPNNPVLVGGPKFIFGFLNGETVSKIKEDIDNGTPVELIDYTIATPARPFYTPEIAVYLRDVGGQITYNLRVGTTTVNTFYRQNDGTAWQVTCAAAQTVLLAIANKVVTLIVSVTADLAPATSYLVSLPLDFDTFTKDYFPFIATIVQGVGDIATIYKSNGNPFLTTSTNPDGTVNIISNEPTTYRSPKAGDLLSIIYPTGISLGADNTQRRFRLESSFYNFLGFLAPVMIPNVLTFNAKVTGDNEVRSLPREISINVYGLGELNSFIFNSNTNGKRGNSIFYLTTSEEQVIDREIFDAPKVFIRNETQWTLTNLRVTATDEEGIIIPLDTAGSTRFTVSLYIAQ